MIITETKVINGKELKHTYSDENFYIQKEGTNEVYSEAYDLLTSEYTYIETDEKIEDDKELFAKL